jgi:DNA-binding MarR family transcriptional regulator
MGMKPRRKAVKTTAANATLSALASGDRTVKQIAKTARMTPAAVSGALSKLQKKGDAARTNKKGFAVAGVYKATPSGRGTLRRVKKDLKI